MGSTVGDILKRERLRAELTQDALAVAAGCSKAQLSLIESGQRSLSPELARRLEQALSIMDGRLIAALNWDRTPPAVRAEISASIALTERLRQAMKRPRGLDAMHRSGELRRLVEQVSPPDDSPRKAGSKVRGRKGNIIAPLPMGRLIPVINRVAAGYPREFTDLDYPASVADEYITCPEVADPGAFAARVVGDSMEPEYHEGDIVIFSPSLPTPSGGDCFIRLERDSETTFKRVYFENDGRRVRLQPLNSAFAPKVVQREDIAGLYAAAYVMRKVESRKMKDEK